MKRLNYTLFSIILLAFILRLFAVVKSGSFYFDEMFSFTYSQKPLLISLQYWLMETNPPLHMVLLKIWLFVTAPNEFYSRLLSALFGTISIYFFYKLGKLLFDKSVAFFATLLLALAPYHIFISSINRGYSLLLLLTILSLFYFFKIFFDKSKKKEKIIYAIINFLLLFTHLTAIFIIISQIIVLFIKNKKKIIQWLQINIITLTIWLVWFIYSLIKKANIETMIGSWFLNLRPGFKETIKIFQLLLFGPNSYAVGIIFIILICALFAITLIKQIRQVKINYSLLYLLIITAIPIVTIIFFRIWNIKFFIIAMPTLILAISYAISYLFKHKIKYFLISVVCIVLLFSIFNLLTSVLPVDNWSVINNTASKITDKDKTQVFIYNSFIYRDLFNRYYSANITAVPYFVEDMDYDHAIIKKNFLLFKHSDEEIKKWMDKKNIMNYDTIILLQHLHVGIDLAKHLENKGFVQTSMSEIGINDKPILLVYEKSTTNTKK